MGNTRKILLRGALWCSLLLAPPLLAQSPKPRQASDKPMPRVIAYSWMSLDKWRAFHTDDLARAKDAMDVLFIGDSITEAWDKSGLKVWDEAFVPLNAANFGIGGDTTQNVLWRITEGGVLEQARPRVVVLMIGTNNFGLHEDSPEAVVRGVTAVVKTLRQKLPEATLVVLDIFPRSEKSGDAMRRQISVANEQIAKIGAGDDKVRHLRIWDQFLENDGTLSKEIMPDRLHLSERGYRIWADALLPTLKELLAR